MGKGRDQRIHRKRGVVLTAQAHALLKGAIDQAQVRENEGRRFTYQLMGERTQLSTDTLKKIFDNKIGVDPSSLRLCFEAFGLELEDRYYAHPDSFVREGSSYVERYPAETICYEELLKEGALVRIKAPRQMGKSALMHQVLSQLREHHSYQTVLLTFQEIVSTEELSSLDRFLQCLCRALSRSLGIPDQVEAVWDEACLGSKVSCSTYLEDVILAAVETPLVVCLDDVDVLFIYTQISEDFFGLLRAWYEKTRSRPQWQKLRLAIIHSTEVYIQLNIHQSPFNVGLPIELGDLSPSQVQRLAYLNQLDLHSPQWGEAGLTSLLNLVGGHPYLLGLAFSHLHYHPEITLDHLLSEAATLAGLYKDHLREHWEALHRKPDLALEFARVVRSHQPLPLNPRHAHQLHSMGLVKLQGNCAAVRCELYRRYFMDHEAHSE